MSLQKILIANRGEIALRIMRTCKEMGIKTVAIYSEVDASSLHVKEADEAYCIGPEGNQNSYLNIPKIIAKAMVAHVDAIHPGYGLLSENSDFATACNRYGFKFIGPSAETIETAGNKSNIKKIAMELGIPVIPGSPKPILTLEEAETIADSIGYPVLIKPAAGGGGRGLRVVYDRRTLKEYLEASRREASMSFAFSGVLVEKYLEKPRHIEVQILADGHGNVVHLGERDCSIQHKYQKLIEESPSPALNEDQRQEVTGLALKLAKGINYVNAGTAEFLLDQKGNFYFIELNCRIQVEHPVTEMVTGYDIVREQINIAAGKPLSFSQEDVRFKGWAMECRVNAKDPDFNFRPNIGTITTYTKPELSNVRVDDYIFSGYTVPMFYDSLLSKIITWGKDREDAIKKMKMALEQYEIHGIKTTIPFHKNMLENPVFTNGAAYTTFVEDILTNKPLSNC